MFYSVDKTWMNAIKMKYLCKGRNDQLSIFKTVLSKLFNCKHLNLIL